MSRMRPLFLLCMMLFVGATYAQNEDIRLPITEDVDYTVRAGDALDVVGALFDVSPACLAADNGLLVTDRLVAGETLRISVDCPTYYGDPAYEGTGFIQFPREAVAFEDDCEGYRVQRGDTLDGISQSLDISIISLELANGIEGGRALQANSCLIVPEDAPAYGQFPALASTNPGQGGGVVIGELYVIQPGDTLDGIAQAFDVSVVSLYLQNNIERRSELLPGTSITIPEDAPPYGEYPAITEPIEGELYSVEIGETLDEIAQAFDVQLATLEAANGINPGRNALPGLTILIPAGAPAYGSDEPVDFSALGVGGGFSGNAVVVQPGDTVDGIAAANNVSRECIIEANNLERPGELAAGEVLLIDEDCDPYVGYNVLPAVQIVPADASDEATDEAASSSG